MKFLFSSQLCNLLAPTDSSDACKLKVLEYFLQNPFRIDFLGVSCYESHYCFPFTTAVVWHITSCTLCLFWCVCVCVSFDTERT
jgi:hypothetical protein